MDNATIIKIMEKQHDDLVEVIHATRTAINAETQASADKINMRLDRVVERQDISNGKVCKLEEQTAFIRWVHKKPFIAIPILVVFFTGVVVLIERFGFEFLFKII